MKSLRIINSIIYKTECKELMADGWYRSEPIITKDDDGQLIDNFFMFGYYDEKIITSPFVVFGVYSDLVKAAYSRKIDNAEIKEYSVDYSINREESRIAYSRYEELYPVVRDCAYSNCNAEQKEAVKEYVDCLERFSGPVLFGFYNDLFPSFFKWVHSII